MEINSELIRKKGEQDKKVNKILLKRISSQSYKGLDRIVHELHNSIFEKINCLHCANCCKTTSPIITQIDIEKISKRLRIKAIEFIDAYLIIDEDGDYVFRSAPCPMLGQDNYCSIYNERPTACRTYPHTDRKRFYQLSTITFENSFICPAVQDILSALRNRLANL